MKITRVYTGADNKSHFEDIEVQLKDGGSLTLTLAVNVLKLRGTDRDFVFKIIDQIEEYERKFSHTSRNSAGDVNLNNTTKM